MASFNTTFLGLEAWHRAFPSGAEKFDRLRNEEFDRKALGRLKELRRQSIDSPTIVFAYANACRRLMADAKMHGCVTFLGQFDPGPVEADIVEEEHARYPDYRSEWHRYSGSYVDSWWTEVESSDRIIVNSEWSADCLAKYGISRERMNIVPLVYTSDRSNYARTVRTTFTRNSPLRVLFLGQVILRKGIARIVDAARILRMTRSYSNWLGRLIFSIYRKYVKG